MPDHNNTRGLCTYTHTRLHRCVTPFFILACHRLLKTLNKKTKNRCVADPQVEQPDSFSPAEISLVSISILSFFLFFGLGYSGIS